MADTRAFGSRSTGRRKREDGKSAEIMTHFTFSEVDGDVGNKRKQKTEEAKDTGTAERYLSRIFFGGGR